MALLELTRESAPAPPPAAERPPRRRRSRGPGGMGVSIALSLLPGVALFTTFFIVPLGILVATSLGEWGGAGFTYLGLHNFAAMLGDPVFWKAARNTLIYAAIGVFVQVPLGVLVGILLA